MLLAALIFGAFGAFGAALYVWGWRVQQSVLSRRTPRRLFGFDLDADMQFGRTLMRSSVIGLILAIGAFALGVLSAPSS